MSSVRCLSRATSLGRGMALTAVAAFGLSMSPVLAGETKGYVVSWFYIAPHSEDTDCSGGPNPTADKTFVRILKEQGKSPAEIEKLVDGFPFTMSGPLIAQRGRIDGKPVNVYVNPTSVPDPHIKTVIDQTGYGFDLDGRESTGGFTDPDTGTRGVDNQAYRALGCYTAMRALPPARPGFPSIQWDTTRDQMPAWLIEIYGIDNAQNDDDVQVGIYRAIEPIIRNALGEPQSDMTFRIDPNARPQNLARGKIANGTLTTDAFDFFMTGDPFAMPEYKLKNARLRLKLNASGVSGIVGGYQPWEPIYFSYALAGAQHEAGLSLDVPGIYYALRNLADSDPDPATGLNMAISASYLIEAIPAYVDHPHAQVSQAPGR